MIDVANKWDEGDMKTHSLSDCKSYEKSYLSWNKDTVKDDVILSIIQLSEGKLNLTQGNEELISTTDLLRNKQYPIKYCQLGNRKFKVIKCENR
jgi:hypothetical protein